MILHVLELRSKMVMSNLNNDKFILNVAKALRFQASLPLEFCRQCVLVAGYIINRTPASSLGDKNPFEMLYDRPPSLGIWLLMKFVQSTSSR